ncbi:MAG: hypothetical protein NTV79_10780, partial [Candidatus Aureabacteria bacterium]|nr:hypothetical protein [Candidatus Auribacterota bacterium]
MFTFLKLLEPFLLPPAIIAIAMLACLILLLAGKRKSGFALLALTLVVLYCLSTDFGARPLIGSLTLHMPDPGRAFTDPPDASGAEAIVVLAGGVYRSGPQRPRPELAGTSWKRLWHGLELYWRFGGKLPLFYSGGSGDPFYPIGIEPGLA